MKALIAAHPELGGTVRVLYDSGEWAVVQSSNGKTAHAVVFRSDADGNWVPDRAAKVKVDILGPQPGATAAAAPPGCDRDRLQAPRSSTPGSGSTEGAAREGRRLADTRHDLRGARAGSCSPARTWRSATRATSCNGTAVAWVFKTR